MNLSDAERIVKKVYPEAFAFENDSGGWSICNGTVTSSGHLRIRGVGFHETIEAAWIRAAELVLERTEPKE